MTHENTYRDDKLEGKSLFFVYIGVLVVHSS